MMINQHLAEARLLLRARDRVGSPGPPPTWNPDLIWRPETSRWVLPEDMEEGPIGDVSSKLPSIQDILRQSGRSWDDLFAAAVPILSINEPTKGKRYDSRQIDQIGETVGLKVYVGDSESYNDYLRGKVSEADSYTLAEIDDIMNLMGVFGEALKVFRGQDEIWYDGLKVGEGISLDGFTSTSRQPSMAAWFMQTDEPSSFLDIDLSKTASGLHLYNDGAAETLLYPGSLFQVQGIEEIEAPSALGGFRRVQVIRGRIDA